MWKYEPTAIQHISFAATLPNTKINVQLPTKDKIGFNDKSDLFVHKLAARSMIRFLPLLSR